jgi:transcriptional regulator with XRE-family HTH domain
MGLSQQEVARHIGRHQSYVSKYESGERRLDLIEFLEIAGTLKIEILPLLRDLTREIP